MPYGLILIFIFREEMLLLRILLTQRSPYLFAWDSSPNASLDVLFLPGKLNIYNIEEEERKKKRFIA